MNKQFRDSDLAVKKFRSASQVQIRECQGKVICSKKKKTKNWVFYFAFPLTEAFVELFWSIFEENNYFISLF